MSTDQSRDAQRAMWTVGDYPAVATHLLPISVEVVSRLPIAAGTTVLDIAVGDGNAAIEAARRGARVTGVDLTPAQIEKARARTAALGVDVDLHVGDAEDLPFEDASFDVAMSVMGLIFAPDHERATSELARVVRPGGAVAVTAWADAGWGVTWRRRAAELFPPASTGAGGPDAWGDPATAATRLRSVGLTVESSVEPFAWRFPTVDAAVEFFLANAGPFISFMAMAESAGKGAEARAAIAEAVAEVNHADDGCVLDAPYVLVRGTRPESSAQL